MPEIKLSSQAEKDFSKLPRNYQARILSKLTLIGKDPFLGKDLKGKLSGLRSLKVWPYRIIYEIVNPKNFLWVHRIVHRQGAYK